MRLSARDSSSETFNLVAVSSLSHFCHCMPTGFLVVSAKAQIPLGLTQHDSTRSTCRAHDFWLCRASRTAQLDTTNLQLGSTRNLVCCVVRIKLYYVSYSLACSSSAMLEQHGSSRSTRSSRLARQSRTCRVKSSQVEFGLNLLGTTPETDEIDYTLTTCA